MRDFVAAYHEKYANHLANMDVLARAQVWEGLSGVLPGHKLRNIRSPSGLLRAIREMVAAVDPGLLDNPDMAAWWTPDNTKLYQRTLELANKLVGSYPQIQGVDVLAEDMASTDARGSVFYSAGRETLKTSHGDSPSPTNYFQRVLSGAFLPANAQVLTRRFIARHAKDAIRTFMRHYTKEKEEVEEIADNTLGGGGDKDDVGHALELVFANPGSAASKVVSTWAIEFANREVGRYMAAYLKKLFAGEDPPTDAAMAKELGISTAHFSQQKRDLFLALGQMVQGGTAPVEVLRAISDAGFLSSLGKGRGEGLRPYMASDKRLRAKAIRLAHANPTLRPVLLPLLKVAREAIDPEKILQGDIPASVMSDLVDGLSNGIGFAAADYTADLDTDKATKDKVGDALWAAAIEEFAKRQGLTCKGKGKEATTRALAIRLAAANPALRSVFLPRIPRR